MTVNTTDIVSGPYLGNGVTTSFSYTFRIEDKTQLVVYQINQDLSVQTLVVDSNYTVAGIGVDAGGTITLTGGALATGKSLLIRSNYPQTQITDFDSQGGFFPEVHELSFDKLTFLIQQLSDIQQRRSLLFPDYLDRTTVQNTIPTPSVGKVLTWDSDGSLMNDDVSNLVTNVNLNSTIDRYDSMAALIAASPTTKQAYVSSYYGSWQDTVAGEKGGHFRHKTGFTNASPSRGSATSVSSIGTGTQAGLCWDATGAEWQISETHHVNVKMFGAKGDGVANDATAIQDAVNYIKIYFNPSSTPRRSALSLYFPYGHYKVGSAISLDFGSGEFSSCRIYGDNIIQGSIIEGTHAGNIFQYTVSEFAEIDHLSFRGTGCSAIRQTNLSFYTSTVNIHHCEFDASLYECIYANLILCTIMHNLFGYFGTATAGNHRHIYCPGVPAGNASNMNTVAYNRFYKGSTSYIIDIRTGENWLFMRNNYETNNCPTHKLSGTPNVSFIGDWWEANLVTTLGATPYPVLIQDDTGLIPRTINFEKCHMGSNSQIDYWVLATSASSNLSIKVSDCVGNSFKVGFVFSFYNATNDAGIAEWRNNTLSGYSHPTFQVSLFQNDVFSVFHSGAAIADVTGDGTAYDIVFNNNEVSRLGNVTLSPGTHTAAHTGSYLYTAQIYLSGITSSHTSGVLALVTTGGTYSIRFNPYNMANGSGECTVQFSMQVPMTATNTAKLTLTVSGGTKVVDIKELTTRFTGARVLYG